jgi:hypothetical protein
MGLPHLRNIYWLDAPTLARSMAFTGLILGPLLGHADAALPLGVARGDPAPLEQPLVLPLSGAENAGVCADEVGIAPCLGVASSRCT